MSQAKKYALYNSLALLIVLVVNALANGLPINNLNTGEVAARYPSLFTPAGITFSIWSVIYLLLAGFVSLQWKNAIKQPSQTPLYAALSQWFLLTCLLNVSWILVWHYLLINISVTIMLLLLLTLIKIFLTLQRYPPKNILDNVFIHVPFILYLAWICVATIANVAALFVSFGWSGGFFAPEVWTIIMMSIATALAVIITLRYGVAAFSLVIFWAVAGILIRWNNSEYTYIVYAAIAQLFMLGAVMLYTIARSTRTITNG